MKQNNPTMVAVPVATLNCIKSLLFNSEDGVNLKGIVDDIAGAEENRDLTAINVGLAFKGIVPEIDNKPRFESLSWEKSITKFELLHVSVITNKVRVRITKQLCNKECQWVDSKEDRESIITLDKWLEMKTTCEDFAKEIEDAIRSKETKD